MSSNLAVAAYYLGQFHPTAENDEFWGPGFTEWHKVAGARPLYPGHRQPKLPGKLGFYDLRCHDTLADQIAYSHSVGIDAFCHWHYWFAGKRVLHRPLDAMLELDYPGYKFMLAWANESWSGVWHGAPHKILIEQRYDKRELAEHAKLISRYLETGKYLTIQGRPPFVVYRPKLIPEAAGYLSELKRLVYQSTGSELYLIGNWSSSRTGSFSNPVAHGLDAAVVTPLPTQSKNATTRVAYGAFREALRRAGLGPEIMTYRSVINTLRGSLGKIEGAAHATILTGWDNTPRSGRRGLVVIGYNEQSLRRAAQEAVALESRNEKPLLFVKSWNEWAEGNMLEPVFGEDWSAGEVIRQVLSNSKRQSLESVPVGVVQSVGS
jgi:hypothetical protein